MRVSLSLFLFLTFIVLIISPFIPYDDLLRHLVAYRFDYDYGRVFLYTWWPSFDPYIGFDVIAGVFHRIFKDYSIILLQWVAIFLSLNAFYRFLSDTEENKRLFLTFSYFFICLPFLLQARPKTFMVPLLVFLLTENRKILSILVGILSSLFYHAFWIYILPLIFFKRYHIITLLAGLSFWFLYGGTEYFEFELRLAFIEREVSIGEEKSILFFFSMYPYLLPLLLVFKEKRNWFFVVYFALFNKIRFAEVIVPLLLRNAKYFPFHVNRFILFLPLALLLMIPSNFSLSKLSPSQTFFDMRDVKEEGVFLTQSPLFSFYLIYHNPKAKVIFSPEPGFQPKEIQKLIYLSKTYSCEKLKSLGVDYVIAERLDSIPPCLKPVKIKSTFTLLKVQK